MKAPVTAVADEARAIAQVAYVNAIIVNGAPAFAIHAADGTPMAVTGERDVAVAAIQQHDMQVVSVH
ncbi:MAG: DUF1150 family protein [Acetobacteraceae bacterium]|nr:DUF1150 family protein [Acetobacteraceae bacterium]